MKQTRLSILLFVLVGLALVNLVALDINWLQQQQLQPSSGPQKLTSLVGSRPGITSEVDEKTNDSDLDYKHIIDQKISEAIATISGKETIKETKVVEKVTEQASQPQVIYVPFGGGGSTTSRDWADVGNAEVYLNINDYANVDKVYFEGFVKVKHGNGRAFARLYDVTHGIGVQGGEISTTSETYNLVESGSLNLWAGKNLYRVQIKSLNGYEASFDSGRIKIIVK